MRTKGEPGRIHIILAITLKDIQDALRNRILLSIIIGVLLVMVQGKALPLLFKLTDVVQVAVHNEDESPIVQDLRSNREFRVIEASSSDEFGKSWRRPAAGYWGLRLQKGTGVIPTKPAFSELKAITLTGCVLRRSPTSKRNWSGIWHR